MDVLERYVLMPVENIEQVRHVLALASMAMSELLNTLRSTLEVGG